LPGCNLLEVETSTPIDLAAGEQRTGLEIVLTPQPALTGRIVAAGTHAPIAGVVVLVSGCRAQVCGPGAVTSDAAGRFTIDHVERVELTLIVNMPRLGPHGRRAIDVKPDERTTIDVGDIELGAPDPSE
jgi:carboxypeptidase family protein